MEKRKGRVLKGRMTERRRLALAIAGAVAVAATLLAASSAVADAEREAIRRIEEERMLSAVAFAEAAEDLYSAVEAGNAEDVIRSAGKAEAYLSQSGLKDCTEAYSVIDRICSMSRNKEERLALAEWLAQAGKAVASGDGGEALGNLPSELWNNEDGDEDVNGKENANANSTANANSNESRAEEGRELKIPNGAEGFSAFRNSGDAGEENAKKKAKEFACENARLTLVKGLTFPPSYCWTSENVFVRVSADGKHVLEYCYDRDLCQDGRDVGEEKARRKVMALMEGEIPELGSAPEVTVWEGVYRFEWRDADGRRRVMVEIYADSGRLRRYDAVGYYESLR